MNQQRTNETALTLETELNCSECGVKAVDTFEIIPVGDGLGYISCYECGEPKQVEVP